MTAILSTRELRKDSSPPRPALRRTDAGSMPLAGVSIRYRGGAETFRHRRRKWLRPKSTLARLLLRFRSTPAPARSGTRARTCRAVPPARAARAPPRTCSSSFPDPFSSLNPQMSVGALIEEPMRAHAIGTPKERRDRVADLLTRVGLRPEQADRYPHEFTGWASASGIGASPRALAFPARLC